MLEALIGLLLFVGLAIVAFQLSRGRERLAGAKDSHWPFYARRLLSEPEQVLYHRMVKALPDHIVFAQVQVSRVLGVKQGFNFHEWNNRVNRLSYDFVICTKDGTVLAAIELDDSSHEHPSRATADNEKDRATSAAGVRLIRWKVNALPDHTFIQGLFASQSSPAMKQTASWGPAAINHVGR